jgi:hypothetical protein
MRKVNRIAKVQETGCVLTMVMHAILTVYLVSVLSSIISAWPVTSRSMPSCGSSQGCADNSSRMFCEDALRCCGKSSSTLSAYKLSRFRGSSSHSHCAQQQNNRRKPNRYMCNRQFCESIVGALWDDIQQQSSSNNKTAARNKAASKHAENLPEFRSESEHYQHSTKAANHSNYSNNSNSTSNNRSSSSSNSVSSTAAATLLSSTTTSTSWGSALAAQDASASEALISCTSVKYLRDLTFAREQQQATVQSRTQWHCVTLLFHSGVCV